MAQHGGDIGGGFVVVDPEEQPRRGVRQERGGVVAVDFGDLRQVLPNQHRGAVGAQQAGLLFQHVEATEHGHLVEQEHHLAAGFVGFGAGEGL